MLKSRRKDTRWSGFVSRWRERLARSRQVFLLSLLVACGIEVVVDWNGTLFEINVLRDRVRERGVSYVHILAGAADEAMVRQDTRLLAQLSEGLFADEDVIYVRFVDPSEKLLYEQLEPAFGKAFEAERGQAFAAYFAKLISRDLHGVMFDFTGQKERMSKSKYRDLPLRWNDLVGQVSAVFVAPTPVRAGYGRVLYQEALRTLAHERESAVTYALGTVPKGDGIAGAVLVAFSMQRTNLAIRNKYLKGLGMVLFFVALILVQNVSSRSDKLRLLDLERRYAQAKQALRDALPEGVLAGGLLATGALDQAEGTVDGQLFSFFGSGQGIDVLLVDPDGEGIEAAAVALQVRQAFLARRASGPVTDLMAEATALGVIGAQIPLSRPLGLWLLHAETSGAVTGLCGPIGGIRRVAQGKVVEAGGFSTIEAPAGVVGPLRRFEGTLGAGESLLLASAGLGHGDRALDLDALGAFVARTTGEQVAADAALWARGSSTSLASHDLTVVTIARNA